MDQPFILRTPAGEERVPPGWDAAAALQVFDQRVERAVAQRSGVLELTFESTLEVEVPVEASGCCENWQITFPDGRMWIGLPGGGGAS